MASRTARAAKPTVLASRHAARSSELIPPDSLGVHESAIGDSESTSTRPRLVRRTLQHNVYDFLRLGLMSGEYAPGDRLTVRGVAARIGTSVMPVREAFRRLTTEGALEPLSTGATRVPVLDFERLQDIMEIRATVEGLATRRAAVRITEAEFQALQLLNEQVMRATRTGDVAVEACANERFHFTIYRAARSEELLRIIQHLWLQVGPYLVWLLRRGFHAQHRRIRGVFRHHNDILIALRRKDPDGAEAALRADLSLAHRSLIDLASRLPRSAP